MRGRVKKFDNKLGYGFIKSRDFDSDIFVHYSEIQEDGYKTLERGEVVDFDFDKDLIKATNVRKIYSSNYKKSKSYNEFQYNH